MNWAPKIIAAQSADIRSVVPAFVRVPRKRHGLGDSEPMCFGRNAIRPKFCYPGEQLANASGQGWHIVVFPLDAHCPAARTPKDSAAIRQFAEALHRVIADFAGHNVAPFLLVGHYCFLGFVHSAHNFVRRFLNETSGFACPATMKACALVFIRDRLHDNDLRVLDVNQLAGIEISEFDEHFVTPFQKAGS
jgi:hypothetical protein